MVATPLTKDQRGALVLVRSLFERLRAGPTDSPGQSLVAWFGRRGGWRLSGAEADMYYAAHRELVESFAGPPGRASRSSAAVESLLRAAIVSAFPVSAQTGPRSTFEGRMSRSLSRLKKSLLEEGVDWTVRFPLVDAAAVSTILRFGRVSIFPGTAERVERMVDAMYDTRSSRPSRRRAKVIAENKRGALSGLSAQFVGRPYAEIVVRAYDPDAAKALALAEVRRTLDVLTFFEHIQPKYRRCRLSLPPDRSGAELKWFAHRASSSKWSSPDPEIRAAFDFPAAALRRRFGFNTAHRLLMAERTDLSERILASLSWAGRASKELRMDSAFVMYGVALESLLTKKRAKGGVSDRLRLRVSQILSSDRERRRGLHKLVGDLYGIRSDLVHGGISDAMRQKDLETLRMVVQEVLTRFLTRLPFRKMTRDQDVERWFDDRVFSG